MFLRMLATAAAFLPGFFFCAAFGSDGNGHEK